jgi:hypothetical protein
VNLITAVALDPGPGGHATLGYVVGLTPLTGDVVLREGGVISDVLRWNSGGVLFFYSDNLDGADAPADTGPPSAFNTNILELLEVGPEAGPNGIFYTPGPGQPGFVTGAAITYNVISDSARIPEPASLLIVSFALVALGVTRKRKSPLK